MKKYFIGLLAIVFAITAVSFTNAKKEKDVITYYFTYDENGVNLLLPQFPALPPTSMPVLCDGPQQVLCMSEYLGYYLDIWHYPIVVRPLGSPITTWLKPLNQ